MGRERERERESAEAHDDAFSIFFFNPPAQRALRRLLALQVARQHRGKGAKRYRQSEGVGEGEEVHVLIGEEEGKRWRREFKGWGEGGREWATRAG